MKTNKVKELSRPIGGGRINYLDALKCLGILLVIEGHVRGAMGIKVYDTLSGLMLYSFNMPIFFFISGFLAYRGQMSLTDTVLKTWKKFILLVIPAIVFRVFLDLCTSQSVGDYLHNGVGGYWFTIVLFECFLVFYTVRLICRNEKYLTALLLILAVISIGAVSLFGEFGPVLMDLNRFCKYFQYFVFGILAMKYKDFYERSMSNERAKAIALIAYFAILFTINNHLWPQPVFHILRDIVFRYLGTFIIISFFFCNKKMFNNEKMSNKLVLAVGKSSLAIYLLQYFFVPNFDLFPIKDLTTIHIISFLYTLVIGGICMLFIHLLSNSNFISTYVLGKVEKGKNGKI